MLRFALFAMFAAVAPAAALDAAAAADESGKIRVLLTYGGHGFQQKPFFALFDALPGVVTTRAEIAEAAGMFQPGLEKRFNVIVRYDVAAHFTPQQQAGFVELLQAGIGLVSLHHNLGAHEGWPEYRHILGGAFVHKSTDIDGKTYGPSVWSENEDIRVITADRKHPITAGLTDFQIHDETYGRYYLSPRVKVLLATDHPQNEHSLAWVHRYGKSRVFYFQLGHGPAAWENPNYAKILINAVRWAAGK